jgi:hypothetical protein
MAGLEKVSKGQKLRVKAETWNTFVDVANHVRLRTMNQGSPTDRLSDDATPFKNSASSDMPQYGVGWLTDAAFQGLSVVKQPSYPCISRIIIASKPAAANGLGAGWTEGLRPVRVSNWAGISVGQRIGAQAGSWDAAADPLGPMLVIGKLESPLVAVLITRQRGSYKMVKFGSGMTDVRPIQVLIVDTTAHSVAQTAPNVLTISKVTP